MKITGTKKEDIKVNTGGNKIKYMGSFRWIGIMCILFILGMSSCQDMDIWNDGLK